MNGYLLDTHVLRWWLCDSPNLAREVKERIRDPCNRIFVSVAAVWEMIIERSLGGLDFPADLREVPGDNDISLLDIGVRHVLQVANLPMIHRDPFDRIQIAQAQVESLVQKRRATDGGASAGQDSLGPRRVGGRIRSVDEKHLRFGTPPLRPLGRQATPFRNPSR